MVSVLDTNDNTPEFQGRASVNVREDTSAGTDILTLTATDRDAGLNGTVLYEMISGNEQGKRRKKTVTQSSLFTCKIVEIVATASTQYPPCRRLLYICYF